MSEEEDIGELDITDEMIAEGRSYTGVMPDDMPKMMSRTILGIDWFSLKVGQIACWLTVPVFLSMFIEVTGRHFFGSPTMWSFLGPGSWAKEPGTLGQGAQAPGPRGPGP